MNCHDFNDIISKICRFVIFFRSSGDTLTRENFHKLKNKLAEARLLTMQRRASDSTQNVFGEDNKSTSEESGSSLDSEETSG